MASPSYRCSPSGVCMAIEKYIAGFKPEHIYMGLQVAVAFTAALILITAKSLEGELQHRGAVWAVVTIAVVMEPNMGGALRKGTLRALGALLGGGLAFAVVAVSESADSSWDPYDIPPIVACLFIAGTAIFGFLLTICKQRYPDIEHFFFVALFTLVPVLTSAITLEGDELSFQMMGWRLLSVLLGIAIATLVSVFVFPIRARWVLQRDMASMLIRMGDLTVWILSQVCAEPNADFSFPGTSYTDKAHTYSDNGVEAQLAPLMAATRRLGKQLASLSVLLEAADKEWYFFKEPRVFPTAKYRLLLERCHIVLSLETTLLYRLQSSAINLALVHASARDVRELGVRASSACVALSHLVLAPKGSSKKGGGNCGGKAQGPARWRRMLRLPKIWHGNAELDPELHAAAEAAAAEAAGGKSYNVDDGGGQGDEQQQERQQKRQRHQQGRQQGQQQLGADLEAPAVAAEDNPFAELAAAQLASESQAQQLGAGEPAAPGVAAGVVPPPTLPPGAAAVGPAAAASQGNRQDTDSGGELGAMALAKLCNLMDSMKWLLQALATERASAVRLAETVSVIQNQDYICGALQEGAAYDTLSLVVLTGMDIMRQLAAMFTALDPGRSAVLHDYAMSTVIQLGEPRQRPGVVQGGFAVQRH